MNRTILPPFIIALALITYRGAKNSSYANNPIPHLPLPSQYLSAALVFGLLSIPTGPAGALMALTGWGLDVAILLKLWTPGEQVQQALTSETKGVKS